MAKAIITGDWHLQTGIYTDICLDYLDHLMSYGEQNEIKIMIIVGDIFEKSSKIHNDAFIPLFFKFMEMKEAGWEIYIVLGNHDIFSVDNDSLVETFSVFGKVIKDFEQIEIDGKEIDFLAYTKDPTDVPQEGGTLMTHLSIADFQFDNKYHVNEKAGMPRSTFEGYDLVFTGHFHRPQQKGNVIYVGSPYQMNFGEKGQEKGFVVFDLQTNEWERVIYDQAPVYKVIDGTNFLEEDVENCFIQVEIKDKVDNFVKLKHILYEKGAIDVSPVFCEEVTEVEIDQSQKIDMDNTVPAMVKEYILNVKIKDIDNQKLVKIFDKTLKEL